MNLDGADPFSLNFRFGKNQGGSVEYGERILDIAVICSYLVFPQTPKG